ncbi:DUF4258 domain-containing protein [Nitrosomonas marina]|uniref:DUF4258 domain-containing protein n=1 Tax=Nitrosomonas marina TaxID=917 RepID=A0A1H8IRX9_9PROT|nr:DUF4258 domain-containing protein [Nitrosomonas marina]SEN71670.1 protein of unknown function [Nitrosomonas marina]
MKKNTNKVVSFDLTPQKAKQIISKLAEDSGRVFILSHAEERMVERDITRMQVIRCLKHGVIVEGPYRDIKFGLWRQTLEVRTAGNVISVVASLDRDDKGDYIVVVTVF